MRLSELLAKARRRVALSLAAVACGPGESCIVHQKDQHHEGPASPGGPAIQLQKYLAGGIKLSALDDTMLLGILFLVKQLKQAVEREMIYRNTVGRQG